MIRKTIIVVLTLVAVATAAIWLDSFRMHSGYPIWRKDIPFGEDSLGMNFSLRTTATGFYGPGSTGIWYSAPDLPRLGLHPHARRNPISFSHWERGEFSFMRHLFTFTWNGKTRTGSYCFVGFPLWAASALFAAYPALALIRGPLRRRRRRKRGLCEKCGYNLTGNESGKCPECGKEVKLCDRS